MNSPRWAAFQRTAHILRARPAALRAHNPSSSFRTVHAPNRAASTTLQPQLKPWPPWTSRLPQLRFSRPYRTARCVRYYSSTPSPHPTPHLGSPPSFGQRLKKLSKDYGWTAVGVYFALSVLDFPFCFLAVRTLGTERIGHWEHVVVESIKDVVRIPFPNLGKGAPQEALEGVGSGAVDGSPDATTHAEISSELQDASKKGDASIWTQLALAYAVHKSFIFIRVPLTAAVLPKVVKTLRGWGWNIGKRTPKTK